MKLYFFAAHTVKTWARSVLDKQESQTGFLLRNDSSSEYNNFTSVRLLFPMNDDSLTVQRLCSEMPRSEPPSQILTHILTFPPLAAFALLPVARLSRTDAGGKRGVGHLNPPASTGKQQLSALLLTLSHSSRTSPQFCGSAAQPRDPRDLMPGAEAFSGEKSISGDCCCCCRFFFFFPQMLMVSKQCRGGQCLY